MAEIKTVLGMSDDGVIPSSYIRIINVFREAGIPLKYVPTTEVEFQDLQDADLILFQRCRSDRSLLFLLLALGMGKAVAYDIDDYLLGLPSESAAYVSPLENGNIVEFLSLSHVATCSTDALRSRLSRWAPQIHTIPNRLKQRGGEIRQARSTQKIFIANTDYFKLNAARGDFFGALRRILEKHKGAEIVSWGSTVPELLALGQEFRGRVTIQALFQPDYNAYMESLRDLGAAIALVPLEATEFHSYKSNIKYLDYASVGLPGIYSDVVPYRGTIQSGATGLLVENTGEAWFQGIDSLISDASARQKIAEASLEDVRRQYPIEQSVAQWSALLAQLAHRSPTNAEALGRLFHAVQARMAPPPPPPPVPTPTLLALLKHYANRFVFRGGLGGRLKHRLRDWIHNPGVQ